MSGTKLIALFASTSIVACALGGVDRPERDRSAASTLGVANTKLAPHHLGDSPELRTWIAACPKLLKVMGADMSVVSAYKSQCDGGKVIVRVWVSPSVAHYSGDGDGRADAEDFWNRGYASVRSLSASQKAQIDYLESANEFDNFDPYKDPNYYNAFFSRFAELAAAEGFHPIVGEIAVGNLDGDVSSCDGAGIDKMRKLVPSFQEAASFGGGWSYHAYTLDGAKSANEDFPFRYRAWARCIPELNSIPLFLTEAGLDKDGDANTSGWQARMSASEYVDWLEWFDGELQNDPYVVGATIFAIGGSGWSSFQLGPIVPQLVDWTNASGRSGASPSPSPSPSPPPPAYCPCGSGIDNFCSLSPNTADCPMTAPGGYCDPNGDGDYSDADWSKGWYDHHDHCG